MTSMPKCFTSGARLAPKEDKKLFVAAYVTPKGDGIQAAADEVNTMHPLSSLSIYIRHGRPSQQTNMK